MTVTSDKQQVTGQTGTGEQVPLNGYKKLRVWEITRTIKRSSCSDKKPEGCYGGSLNHYDYHLSLVTCH